jgi:hypothetical protein
MRPGVVIKAEWDDVKGLYYFIAVAIGCRRGLAQGSKLLSLPITGPGFGGWSPPNIGLPFLPEWPLMNSYCYVFRQPAKFYCLPTQVRRLSDRVLWQDFNHFH